MPNQPRDRSRRLAILLTAILVATTVLAGPASAGGSPAPVAPAPVPATAPHYDGETLLRGLFFRQGPVAADHPEVSLVPVAPTGAVAKLTDRLVTAVRQLDPEFFKRFEADVTSGDRFRVRAALARAAKLLGTAAERIGLETAGSGGDPALGTCVAVAFHIAVAAYKVLAVAAAANIAAAVNAVTYWNVYTTFNVWRHRHFVVGRKKVEYKPPGTGGMNATPDPSLASDRWVEQVAAALAR